jgi:hypothetical protein
MVQPDVNIRGKSGDEVGQEHNSALHHGNDSKGDHEPLKKWEKTPAVIIPLIERLRCSSKVP